MYRRATAKTIFRHLLDVGGTIAIRKKDVVVTLDSRAHNPILAETGLLETSTRMPWLGGKRLTLELP